MYNVGTAQKYLEKMFNTERITKYLEYLENFDYRNIDNLQILDNAFCSLLTVLSLEKVLKSMQKIIEDAYENGKKETDKKMLEIRIALNYLHVLIAQKNKK